MGRENFQLLLNIHTLVLRHINFFKMNLQQYSLFTDVFFLLSGVKGILTFFKGWQQLILQLYLIEKKRHLKLYADSPTLALV